MRGYHTYKDIRAAVSEVGNWIDTFAGSKFRKINNGAKICTMRKFPAIYSVSVHVDCKAVLFPLLFPIGTSWDQWLANYWGISKSSY